MSAALNFRAGSKFGVTFQVRYAQQVAVTKQGSTVQGTITHWARVGVRTILKDDWQDDAGNWHDSIRFYELEPASDENRIALDEFYVAGPFVVTRREANGPRATAAWKAFTPA
jgi:hypothetical protein